LVEAEREIRLTFSVGNNVNEDGLLVSRKTIDNEGTTARKEKRQTRSKEEKSKVQGTA